MRGPKGAAGSMKPLTHVVIAGVGLGLQYGMMSQRERHQMMMKIKGKTLCHGHGHNLPCLVSICIRGPMGPERRKANGRPTQFTTCPLSTFSLCSKSKRKLLSTQRKNNVGRSHWRLLLYRSSCLFRRMHGHLPRLCLYPCVSA